MRDALCAWSSLTLACTWFKSALWIFTFSVTMRSSSVS